MAALYGYFPALFYRTVHIRHQRRKTTILSCHRCLMNTGVKKGKTYKYRLDL